MSRIVFVLGCPRSGSTLLGRMLGEVEGWFDAGEVRNLWGYPLSRRCKCGRSHERCPVWGRAIRAGLERAVGHPDSPSAALRDVARLHGRTAASVWQLPWLWWSARRRGETPGPLAAYAEVLTGVYDGVCEACGCDTIVDTSKLPGDLVATTLVPGVEVYVVLLVRDPRGFVASRRRQHPSGSRWGRAVQDAVGWAGLNAVAELLCRCDARIRWLAVRYEDLVTEPARELNRVVDLVDRRASPPPVDDRSVVLPAGHALVGKQPWVTGRVGLDEDRRWETELSRSERLLVTTITAPLMARWGYLP